MDEDEEVDEVIGGTSVMVVVRIGEDGDRAGERQAFLQYIGQFLQWGLLQGKEQGWDEGDREKD